MGAQKPPKVILFDIGGVVVVSPFRAILRYETTHSIPRGWINTAISLSAPNGQWQRLERGEIPLDDAYFTNWAKDLAQPRPGAWQAYWAKANPGKTATDAPPPPVIDTKTMFWEMMREARSPDPNIYPMLCRLRELTRERERKGEGKLVIAALSNAVIWPPGIRDHNDATVEQGADAQAMPNYFDLFLHSALIGLRKPDAEVYAYAVRALDEYARGKGVQGGVEAGDILFLDDIGANLKGAREAGIRTVRVKLNHTDEAVREVEDILGVSLTGDRAKL
ncbi:epoxide hydrolase [Pseudovirgaria hyperparasitica]|uniref:Epoxide hydrolase n=1 Tax=Pseudovirgaria hyperparasitica TaxID=470096 RepID=A0A6A6WBP9_9PEZI|nr:epoxide hydrolase [Pseudovirgaria hyperparasitica]KAF2759027.1 epoxide hydrolase [Pseudovirgaria hyperparasitica]